MLAVVSNLQSCPAFDLTFFSHHEHYLTDADFVIVTMGDIELDVSPGIVSGIYFVLFTFYMLSIVDVVLIHSVSALYYKRIHRGIPLEVKSAEIPGVATSLVGSYFSPPNLLAYVVKIGLLACVLVIDSNVNSVSTRSDTYVSVTGTFVYDPSEDKWPVTAESRAVERRWETVRQCHTKNEDNTELVFYRVAFNLLGNLTVEDELTTNDTLIYPIDDSSVVCLARDQVHNESVRVHVVVVGCSQLEKTSCFNETVISRIADLPLTAMADTVTIVEGSSKVSFDMYDHSALAPSIWPSYDSPAIICMRTAMGVGNNKKIIEACVVTSYPGGENTLIERWEYNREKSELSRRFPGPIFKGIYNLSLYQKAVIVQNVLDELNWETFSGQVIADGSIYERDEANVTKFDDAKLVTTVPVYTVILTVILLVITTVAWIIVSCTIGKDERPHLNTTDGLSSVAREENEPSGRSMVTGRGMVIGLTMRDGRSVHFGPLGERDVGVVKKRGVFVE